MISDRGNHSTTWRVSRYANEEDYRAGVNYTPEQALYLFGTEQHSVFEKNALLNEGITELLTLACLTGAVKFDNANAYLGVGDGTDAVVATQTGLQGTNKAYKAMDVSYPQVVGTTVTFVAVFGANDGNFAWQECTVANGPDDNSKNLNRRVQNMGTKENGVWRLQVDITIS